jgi:RNA polymerase sigma-70 factor (ECF subfamily)
VAATQEDYDWVQRFQNPKERANAFSQWIEIHQRSLYLHIFRMTGSHQDTDDLLQESFIKAWNHIDAFQFKSKLRTWLFSIAIHETLSFLRKKRMTQSLTDMQYDIASVSGMDAEDGELLRIKLTAAVAELPAKQQAVFCMRYFQELPYSEIAAITGTSEGALKASYFHAAQKIEKYILGH